MKKTLAITLVGLTFLSSGCAFHNGLTSNLNNHTTEVVRTRNNFRNIEAVQGSTQAMYVFGFGGLRKQALVAEARANMLAKAKLPGTSRAVINETVEIKHSFFPIVRMFKVTVSAQVIEFTD